ncbi:MAG: hypothetical protein QOK16_3377 [Solirubrobacteraceae bacterium]|nr:hypothetical protein [Solirubrobacteraceae bacterium]MEA2188366.1 hypothetical protein [Solirubrobacteraceae bacterium]
MSDANDAPQLQEIEPTASIDAAFVAQPDPPVFEAEQLDVPDVPYVYALGRIEPRFPSLAVEKEFAQATGRANTVGLTDRQALQEVLSERSNRYLARMLCWVLTIEGLETYVLLPGDPSDLELLIDALRPTPRPTDVDVVIGLRGAITPPHLCNGLMVPTVIYDQIYSFDVDALLESIPRPDDADEKQFAAVAEEVLWRILQLADNAGATDEHRALNYLAVRYPALYANAAEQYAHNATLTSVEVRPSRLSGVRNIVNAILSYTHRQTDVTDKQFVRVDVTEEYPFLVSKLMPYYDR